MSLTAVLGVDPFCLKNCFAKAMMFPTQRRDIAASSLDIGYRAENLLRLTTRHYKNFKSFSSLSIKRSRNIAAEASNSHQGMR